MRHADGVPRGESLPPLNGAQLELSPDAPTFMRMPAFSA
jgi:hypothetical protein